MEKGERNARKKINCRLNGDRSGAATVRLKDEEEEREKERRRKRQRISHAETILNSLTAAAATATAGEDAKERQKLLILR